MRAALPLLALAAALFALPAAAETVSGTIEGYECGDNCYLTIASETGEEVVGLCAAAECMEWNAAAEMPEYLIGSNVHATVEMRPQTDAEGNVMGEFPAFTDMVFDN